MCKKPAVRRAVRTPEVGLPLPIRFCLTVCHQRAMKWQRPPGRTFPVADDQQPIQEREGSRPREDHLASFAPRTRQTRGA